MGQLRLRSQRSTELMGLVVGLQGRWDLAVGREVGVEALAPLMERQWWDMVRKCSWGEGVLDFWDREKDFREGGEESRCW